MMDEANPKGMKRMVHHRGQQDYPTKRTYPIGRKREPYQRSYVAGEGNDPKGMERPDTTGY